MIPRILITVLATAGFAAAQQEAIEEKLRQQVAEISRLMRESERLLLEITRVDRLVEAQKQVEDELKKLIPPEQGGAGGGGGDERAQERRQQLESRHGEIAGRLEEMLKNEREKSAQTVQQLRELLENLPRQEQQGQGPSQESKQQPSQAEQEKRLREREEQERKQHQPRSPRDQRDQKDKQRRDDRNQRLPEDPSAAVTKRVEAWIAKLPPEEQERINRNDFSRIPIQYRALVEEYTAQRAKREAQPEDR